VGGWRGEGRSGGIRVLFFLTEVNLEEGEEGRIARASKVRKIEDRKQEKRGMEGKWWNGGGRGGA